MTSGSEPELPFYLTEDDQIALAWDEGIDPSPELWRLHASMEVEFLVAREKQEIRYTDDQHQNKFVCSLGDVEPLVTVLTEIKLVLERKGQDVDMCLSLGHVKSREEELVESHQSVFKHWLVCPGEYAAATDNSPVDYEWIGVKVRTPMIDQMSWRQDKPVYIEMMEEMRRDVVMHVNSTCHLNVYVQFGPDVMDEELGKKLVTLLWLTEEGLLNKLCPLRATPTVRSNCRLTLSPRDTPEDAMPIVPREQMMIQAHLPRVLDDRDQVLLYHIWRAESIEVISRYLWPKDASSDIGFKLHIHDKKNDWNPGQVPTIEFRYALWHPHEGHDTTKYWLCLCMKYVHACKLVERSYKLLLGGIDRLVHETRDEVNKLGRLLSGMGLQQWVADDWQEIIKCYERDGWDHRQRQIDSQGILQ